MEARREDETEHAEKPPPRWRRWLVPLLGFCLFSAIAVIADKVFDALLPKEAIVEHLNDFRDDLAFGLKHFSPAEVLLTFQQLTQPPPECEESKADQESPIPAIFKSNSTLVISKSDLVDTECPHHGVQGEFAIIVTLNGWWKSYNFLRPLATLFDTILYTFRGLQSWEEIVLIGLQILISGWLIIQWYTIPRLQSDQVLKALFWSPFLIVLYSYSIGCVIYFVLFITHWVLVLATGYIGGFCAAVLPERIRSPVDSLADKFMEWLKEWLEHVF